MRLFFHWKFDVENVDIRGVILVTTQKRINAIVCVIDIMRSLMSLKRKGCNAPKSFMLISFSMWYKKHCDIIERRDIGFIWDTNDGLYLLCGDVVM